MAWPSSGREAEPVAGMDGGDYLRAGGHAPAAAPPAPAVSDHDAEARRQPAPRSDVGSQRTNRLTARLPASRQPTPAQGQQFYVKLAAKKGVL